MGHFLVRRRLTHNLRPVPLRGRPLWPTAAPISETAAAAGLTQTLPNEPLKLSMRELSAIIGMLSAMDWNAVRNGLE